MDKTKAMFQVIVHIIIFAVGLAFAYFVMVKSWLMVLASFAVLLVILVREYMKDVGGDDD